MNLRTSCGEFLRKKPATPQAISNLPYGWTISDKVPTRLLVLNAFSYSLTKDAGGKHIGFRCLGFVLAFSTVLATTPASLATTIVVVAAKNQVTMGSDSRVELVGPDRTVPGTGCKIQQTNNVFVAAAGFLVGHEFSVYDLARKASSGGGGVVAIANRFEYSARMPFTRMVQGLNLTNHKAVETTCKNVPGGCLQVAFAGFEDGRGVVSIRSFTVSFQGGKVVVNPAKPVDWPKRGDTGGFLSILGEATDAGYLYNRSPQFFKLKGFVGGVDALIEEEIRVHPALVSQPISILKIDPFGPRWALGHKGTCPPIQGQFNTVDH